MKTLKTLLGLFIGFMIIGLSALAQGTAGLSGKVTNKSGEPLGLTSIMVENLKVGTMVQDDGTYFLVVPTRGELKGKNIEVIVSRAGYKNQTHKLSVDAGVVLSKDFIMEKETADLEPVFVTDFLLVPAPVRTIWTNENKDTIILDVKNSFYTSIIERQGKPKVTHKGLYSLSNGKAAMIFIEGRAYAKINGDKLKVSFYDADDKLTGTYLFNKAN